MTLHSGLTGSSLHTLQAYTWANAAARAAFSAVAADVGKMGFQTDTATFYMVKGTGNDLQEIGAGGGGASGTELIYELDSNVATIRAGETLSANDAVALATFDQDGYLVVKADCDSARFKRSFLGFAVAGVAVTQGDYTFSSSTTITGDVSFDLNGQPYTVAFNTDHDTTIADIATAINNHPDVDTATVNVVGGADNDTITILSGNGQGGSGSVTILIDNGSGTGFTLVFATNVAAAGGAVDIHRIGAMSGFGGLTAGETMYLDTTAGAITNTDGGTCPVVGYAMDATNLLVEPQLPPIPSDFQNLYMTNGWSTFNVTSSVISTVETFNFSSWSSGAPAPSFPRGRMHGGEALFGDSVFSAGGQDTGTFRTEVESFNTISWSAEAAVISTRTGGACAEFLSKFMIAAGSTNGGNGGVTAALSDNIEAYDGAAWATEFTSVSFANLYKTASTIQGGKLRFFDGISVTPANVARHETYDGAAYATDTALPAITDKATIAAMVDPNGVDALTIRGFGTAINQSNNWNGTAWTANLTLGITMNNANASNADQGPGGGSANGVAYLNGGSAAGVNISTTVRYNGTTWATDTSSVQTRTAGAAALI